MAASFTKPYVDALRAVGGTAEAVEALLPPLTGFSDLLRGSEELRDTLTDPAVERGRRRAVLSAVAERAGVPPLARRLLEVLLANRRILRLDEVLAALRRRLDDERRLVGATVTSAAPLPDDVRAALERTLAERTQRSVRLAAQVDPGLLGGFVVRIGSEVWDASLSHRLRKARQTLLAAAGGGH